MTEQEERTWGAMAHIIPLAVSLLSSLGWIAALALYFSYKEKSKFVAFHALQNLFFQIVVFICTLLTIPLVFIIIGIPILVLIAIGALILNIVAAVHASNGEWYELPVAGSFAKRHLGV